MSTSMQKQDEKMPFEEAKRKYIYRYTMEHKPEWARQPAPNGKFYAPQYKTDREWYDNAYFPPNNPYATSKHDTSCYSSNQSWPLGQWLDEEFQIRK